MNITLCMWGSFLSRIKIYTRFRMKSRNPKKNPPLLQGWILPAALWMNSSSCSASSSLLLYYKYLNHEHIIVPCTCGIRENKARVQRRLIQGPTYIRHRATDSVRKEQIISHKWPSWILSLSHRGTLKPTEKKWTTSLLPPFSSCPSWMRVVVVCKGWRWA